MLGVEPYVILIEKWVLVLFDDALKVGYGSREVDIMFRILNIYVFLSIFVEILPFLDIEYLIFFNKSMPVVILIREYNGAFAPGAPFINMV